MQIILREILIYETSQEATTKDVQSTIEAVRLLEQLVHAITSVVEEKLNHGGPTQTASLQNNTLPANQHDSDPSSSSKKRPRSVYEGGHGGGHGDVDRRLSSREAMPPPQPHNARRNPEEIKRGSTTLSAHYSSPAMPQYLEDMRLDRQRSRSSLYRQTTKPPSSHQLIVENEPTAQPVRPTLLSRQPSQYPAASNDWSPIFPMKSQTFRNLRRQDQASKPCGISLVSFPLVRKEIRAHGIESDGFKPTRRADNRYRP